MTSAVLVTGGAGYIGSHACKALAAAGLLPVTLDNLSTGHAWAVKWGPLEVGDLRDTDFVGRVIARHEIGAVLHFAARSLVGESAEQPLQYHANNVGGTLSLLAAMQGARIRTLVFSSTCAVYGIPETVPIREETPRHPVNTYGRTKLAAENILMDLAAAGQLDVALLRYFNAAGADPDLEIGEAHVNETHLVPLTVRSARVGAPPLHIYGTDYPTADGTCIRDYIHVTDLAEAHVAALSFVRREAGGHIFNLGTGQGVSVREVLAAVQACMGRPVPVIEAPRRQGDPPVLVAANEKACRQLDWRPRRSDIASIVGTAIGWHDKYAASVATDQ